MNKKNILIIAALVAIIGFTFVFSTCNLEDEDERVVNFYNASEAKIAITCIGSEPNSFTLNKATIQGDKVGPVKVTRKGKDIVIDTITILEPSNIPSGDEDQYITVEGSASKGKIKGSLRSGDIIFKAVQGNNILQWDVNTLDE